jgi:hypothetical protein
MRTWNSTESLAVPINHTVLSSWENEEYFIKVRKHRWLMMYKIKDGTRSILCHQNYQSTSSVTYKRVRFETMNLMFPYTASYKIAHTKRRLPHTRPMAIVLVCLNLDLIKTGICSFNTNFNYPTFKTNFASMSQVWSYEPRAYTFIGYMAVVLYPRA